MNPLFSEPLPSAVNTPAEVKVDGMVPLLLVYWLVPRSIPVTPNTYAGQRRAGKGACGSPLADGEPGSGTKCGCVTRSVVGFDEFYVACVYDIAR